MESIWFGILTIATINIETSTASEPDITLLSRVSEDNYAEFTCVAGSNVQDSALTFILPLGGIYKDISQESKYVSGEEQQLNSRTIDCDFVSNCQFSSEWVKSELRIIKARDGLHNLAAVTDERWERFPTVLREKSNYLNYTFKEKLGIIGISVRTSEEINIHLEQTNLRYSIKMNKIRSELRECEFKSSYIRSSYWNCKGSQQGDALTNSERYWNHIQIILSRNLIKIRTPKKLLLNYNVETPLDIYKISLENSNKALWKIHDYSYLSLFWDNKDNQQWLKVGPIVKPDVQGSLCISLYAATCGNCTLRFRLSQSLPYQEIQGNSTQEMQFWQLVKLKIKDSANRDYQLQIKINGGSQGFWLIDGVRRCNDGENRLISMKTNLNQNDAISCFSLKHPDWWASLKGGKINSPSLQVCNNGSFTGSNCNVSCSSALMGGDCSRIIVCEPSQNRSAPRCSCAAGYHGDMCQDDCMDGKYGSNCGNVCSPCRNYCEKISGYCPPSRKCVFNDVNPGCSIGSKKPENISVTWNEDKINIYWKHPEASITITFFIIKIELLNTDLLNMPSFNFTEVHNVTNKEHYIFEVPNSIPLSSRYMVCVRTGNEIYDEVTLEVSSGPVTPRFVGALMLGLRTDHTQIILVPAAHPDTITYHSSLFIFVCDMTSIGAETVFIDESHSAFHNWTECKGISWIVAGLQVTNQAVNFTVGESDNNLYNKKLSPDSTYVFSVIFINEYVGKKKYTVSTVVPSSSASSLILVVLLVLIFLILMLGAGFIWWKLKRQATKSDIKVSYHAVSNNPEPTLCISNISESNNVNTNGNNILHIATTNNNNNHQHDRTISETVNNEIQNVFPFSKTIDVSKFSNYVKECIENNELEKQFELLPEGQTKKSDIGLEKNNVMKNRYKNLTAYDHSRVVLEKIPGEPYSDFINANYIDGYKQKNAYIATQGPKPNTVNDFWRMIWQENIKCIVMMTNLIEEGKQKCHKYWPDIGKSETYGIFKLSCIKSDIYADYEYRTFEIVNKNTSRKIQQYHFTSWPDHGVPMYPQSLVPFLNKLLLISPAQAPIVVHCSAGVGRTGTIILSDICLRMVAGENKIDVLKYFHSMREQRSNMVAKYDQYELVHMVLLECLLTSNTTYPCKKLEEYVEDLKNNKGMRKQLQYLNDTAWYYQTFQEFTNELDGNSACNRFPDIVPSRRRIHLTKTAYDSSDYINAVPVDGFRNKGQFIVTQNPLPHTIKDFWKMVIDFNVKDIISLNELVLHDVTNIKFWPNENEPMTPLPYLKVIYVSKSDDNVFERYKLKIVDNRNKDDDGPYYVYILQLKNWLYENLTPANETYLISLVEEIPKIPRIGSPIVVTCYDGARASGLYVALSFIIEKIKLEQVCDVCLAVRTVRSNREQFVTDIKQFEYLYEAAKKYILSFETYSNFNY